MVNGGFTEREDADESNADKTSTVVGGEDGERGHKKKKNKTKKVKQPKDKECFTKIISIRKKIILTKLFILFSIICFDQFWKYSCFENTEIELIQRIRLQK